MDEKSAFREAPKSLRNPRVTVLFSDEAMEWMEKEARKRSTSIADLIRRIVDETRGSFIRHR